MDAPTASVVAGQTIGDRPGNASAMATFSSGMAPMFDTLKLYVIVCQPLLPLAAFVTAGPKYCSTACARPPAMTC
jgi:hypothetical protein